MRTATPRTTTGIVALIAAAPLVFSLAGCGSHSAIVESDYDSGNRSAMPTAPRGASTDYSKNAAAEEFPDPGAGSSRPSLEQQIIVSGSMRVAVDDPAYALEQATTIAKDLKGSASSTDVDNSGTHSSASAALRISADSYEEAVARISTLGDVKEKRTNTEDVGALSADLDARIEALKTSTARLTDLMTNASSTTDLIEAERELTNRQSELDAITAQRAWLDDQVQYSTLEVTFRTKAGTEASSPSMWKESWDAFLGGVGVLIYAIVMLLPWLIVIIPVALLIRWWFKRRRARKEARERAEVGTAPAESTEERASDSGTGPAAE